MVNHSWMSDVLDDLTSYCEKNGLNETMALVELSKRIFESELRAASTSTMTLEKILTQASQQPA